MSVLADAWRIAFLTAAAPVLGAVLLLAVVRLTGARWEGFAAPGRLAPTLRSRGSATITRELLDLRRAGQAAAPCFVLHRMGFVVPRSSRRGRWALTPPFHPDPRLALSRKTRAVCFL